MECFEERSRVLETKYGGWVVYRGWEDDDVDILMRRKKARKKNDDIGGAEYPSLWWIDCWFLRKRNLPRRRGGSSDQCNRKEKKITGLGQDL